MGLGNLISYSMGRTQIAQSIENREQTTQANIWT